MRYTYQRNGIGYLASIRRMYATWNNGSNVSIPRTVLVAKTIDRAIAEKSDYEVEFRILPPDAPLNSFIPWRPV